MAIREKRLWGSPREPHLDECGSKSGEAFAQLYEYAKRVGGKAYDANTGFKTPAGGVVSPDASWVCAGRASSYRDTKGYWQMMPDAVVEVVSVSDTWREVTEKIDKYFADGAGYAIALDPETRAIYELGLCPEGLALDHEAIFDA